MEPARNRVALETRGTPENQSSDSTAKLSHDDHVSSNGMESLLKRLRLDITDVTYRSGESFCWSPEHRTITFRGTDEPTELDQWALLHEAGHAMLDHKTYTSDLHLLLLEVEAWDKAVEVGKSYGIGIDLEHVQDCLDTYRDWLHQRSLCPACSTTSLQATTGTYRCHNCTAEWHVTTSRFCRAYRRRKLSAIQRKALPKKAKATFV